MGEVVQLSRAQQRPGDACVAIERLDSLVTAPDLIRSTTASLSIPECSPSRRWLCRASRIAHGIAPIPIWITAPSGTNSATPRAILLSISLGSRVECSSGGRELRTR